MRTTGWITATVVSAALVAGGGGVDLADTGTPAPPPKSDAVCTTHIPNMLARIDRVTARINGDAATRGSTAWLQARADQARGAGRTALADLIDIRLQRRPDRLAELAQLKSDVLAVQSKDCSA